jgi:hypothetical protein
MAGRVAGRMEHLEAEVAEREHLAVGERRVDGRRWRTGKAHHGALRRGLGLEDADGEALFDALMALAPKILPYAQPAWRLLDQAGVFRTSFNTNAMSMAFADGGRNYGLRMLGMVHALCPDQYPAMMKEQAHDERTNDDGNG